MELARESNDRHVQEKALFWLGQHAEEEEVLDFLAEVIEEGKDTRLQEKALFALSQAPRHKGVSYLIRFAKDHESFQVRKKAIFYLGQSNDPRAKEVLLEIINQEN
jgi:HEAT repeat protein